MLSMHWIPEPDPQQSLAVVHFSYSVEQPAGIDPHVSPPASPARQ
jgi:hypothetical protein